MRQFYTRLLWTNKTFFWNSDQFDVDNTYWTRNSTNNLSSYFGLIDARMSAFDKEEPLRLQIVTNLLAKNNVLLL
jgi:hypothetical protein